MVLADLDRDGSLDLITSGKDSHLVLSSKGLGDAGFAPGRIVANVEGILAATAGDLDLDGAVDIVAGSSEGLFAIVADAGGGFSAPTPIQPGVGAYLRPNLEDLDGDSLPEIVAPHLGSRSASVLWNEGGGAFGQPDTLDLPAGALHLAALDADRDGDRDLAIPLANSLIAFLENQGGRRFAAWRNLPIPETAAWLAPVELDGDGDMDLVASGNLNIIALLQAGGTGLFTTMTWRSPSSHGSTWGVGDLDLNGSPDMALLNDGMVFALQGLGAGEFAAPRVFAVPGESPEPLIAIGDLDGDLDPDLVASTSISRAVVLRNTHGSPGADCNANGIPDECDLPGNDLDGNGIPDSCDPDCNGNSIPDGADNTLDDCDGNGVPDECQIEDEDCNRNGIPDPCDLSANPSYDCDGNGILDSCDVANDFRNDCNGNRLPDACDVAGMPSFLAPRSVGLGTNLHSLSAADMTVMAGRTSPRWTAGTKW